MAEPALIAGNLINEERPLAVEIQAGANNIGDVDVLSTPGLAAARAGTTFCLLVNKKSGINGGPTVLTDASLLKAILAGYRDVIRCIYAHMGTASDWCEFEIGCTANADGTGAFTAMTPLFSIESPTNRDAAAPHITDFDPPIIITPSMGGAWTIRAQTNDAAASVTFGLNGWSEQI